MAKMKDRELKELRAVVADYMRSEGCSCCENTEEHQAARAKLAKLLKVPRYKDHSGFDFYRFASKRKP